MLLLQDILRAASRAACTAGSSNPTKIPMMGELYSITVGRYGMNPQYFLDKASAGEIEDFLSGASERERENWERTRLLSFIVSKIGGSDASDIKEFLPFSWDEDKTSEDDLVNERELNELMNYANHIKLNGNLNNKNSAPA